MRLLIIEQSGGPIASLLRSGGFNVDHFSELAVASEVLRNCTYRAVVAEERLPDGDGINWLRKQRSGGLSMPALILNSSARIDERIRAFDAGADDCVPMPVNGRELAARLHAVLRRPAVLAGGWIEFGNLRIDPSSRELCVDGQLRPISRREFDLLETLVRRRGRVVSRTMLEDVLYGQAQTVTTNSLDVCVSRLRRCLHQSGANHKVDTVRGTGYILTASNVVSCKPALASQVSRVVERDRVPGRGFDRMRSAAL